MMGDIFGQLGNIKANVEEAKNKLGDLRIAANSNCGRLSVVVDGNQKINDIHIDTTFEDNEELADVLCNTLNKALENSKTQMKTELEAATGGLLNGMPGL
jgi:DNA-binding protein YbaB